MGVKNLSLRLSSNLLNKHQLVKINNPRPSVGDYSFTAYEENICNRLGTAHCICHHGNYGV